MISNKYVTHYIDKWKNGELLLNEKRIQLIKHLEEKVLTRDDLYFDEEQINNYIAFSEKWFFPLDDWEKFVGAFVFLYDKENDEVFYSEFFATMGRGAGKNGFASTLAAYFISSLHGVDGYDVSIVANSEKQAKISFNECFKVVNKNSNQVLNSRYGGEFEAWKSKITGLATQSIFEYKTSNASSQDGGREGCVIYDEIHEMLDSKIVDVFSGGLGKVQNGRQFFIGTNGYIRNGYYDTKYNESVKVLNGSTGVGGLFPFICELDSVDELNDSDMWEKANPAFEKPLNKRGKMLMLTVKKDYKKLATEPSGRVAFMTKRMNLPEVDLETAVATEDEIMATNRPFFNLEGKTPIGSLDFGSVRDFASCGLLFRQDDEYAFMNHSFAIKHFCDVHYGYSHTSSSQDGTEEKAPIKKWEQMGLMTVVDEPSLNPMHIVDWFVQMRSEYGVQKIVADNFKLDILRPLLEAEGFEVEMIRRPLSIHPLLAPRIEDGFANKKFIFGDNPLMRWYTRNIFVKNTSVGKQFLKVEEVKRKTDGFQSFVHALYRAEEALEIDLGSTLDIMDDLDF